MFTGKALSEGNFHPISYNWITICTEVEYSVLVATRKRSNKVFHFTSATNKKPRNTTIITYFGMISHMHHPNTDSIMVQLFSQLCCIRYILVITFALYCFLGGTNTSWDTDNYASDPPPPTNVPCIYKYYGEINVHSSKCYIWHN